MRHLLIAVLLSTATASPAAELHVAPSGRDDNPGTADRPFATLERARDAIRAMKASGPLAQPVRVIVAEGTYSLARPLVLTPQDTGTSQAPISYEAAPGARPIFSGGRELSGWKITDDGLWTLQIAEARSGAWRFEQLWVNGRRATRARTPNKFFLHMQTVQEDRVSDGEARQTIGLRPVDFQKALAPIRPEEVKNAQILVYHKWDNTRRFLEAVDPRRSALSTVGRPVKTNTAWVPNTPFVLENYRAALDEPGEWFLDQEGLLTYWPLPGEDPATTVVVAPIAEAFVRIQGDPAAGQFVEHLTFRGLAFRHAQWLTPPDGFNPMQAAAPIEAVFLADGARNVVIEDGEIGHAGIYGVWFRRGCRDCTIRRTLLHDLGAGGLRIGETEVRPEGPERTSHITAEDNILRHGGRIFPCAVGVWIGHSPDNSIVHNEIADFFYTGISVGWRWGYAPSIAKRNTIAFNHVHHIGWGLLSDMGGIYTLGPSEGTVVRNNVLHDIHSYDYGGWGLYTDEGSSGILFENNLVYNTKTGSFHQHYGRENIIRNNILAFSQLQQLQATRVEEHLSFTFENNIILFSTGKNLAGPWDRLRFDGGKNLFWNTSGQPVDFLGRSLERWQAEGHEIGSMVADPRFANPEEGDFRLGPDSPALGLGFKPFDPSQAGVRGPAEWIQKAREESYPPLEIAPEPPPAAIDEDFEGQAVGQPPAGLQANVEGRGDAILVVAGDAASGNRCLQVTDAPGLRHRYNPHVVFRDLGYHQGVVRNAFALKIEPGTDLRFEWRDWSGPQYLTGPSFSIRGGELQVPGAGTTPLPVGRWVGFELVATFGQAGLAGWQLEVSPPGTSPVTLRGLSPVNPAFRKLTWVGFSSEANTTTRFFLDDFRLDSVAPR